MDIKKIYEYFDGENIKFFGYRVNETKISFLQNQDTGCIYDIKILLSSTIRKFVDIYVDQHNLSNIYYPEKLKISFLKDICIKNMEDIENFNIKLDYVNQLVKSIFSIFESHKKTWLDYQEKQQQECAIIWDNIMRTLNKKNK